MIFVPKIQVQKAGSTRDYHGQISSANFEKWRVEKLVPNIPPHVVIVLNNTPNTASRLTNHPQPMHQEMT